MNQLPRTCRAATSLFPPHLSVRPYPLHHAGNKSDCVLLGWVKREGNAVVTGTAIAVKRKDNRVYWVRKDGIPNVAQPTRQASVIDDVTRT